MSKPQIDTRSSALKRARVIVTSSSMEKRDEYVSSSVLFFTHALDDSFEKDNARYISSVRKHEKESREATFVVLSLLDMYGFNSESFTNMCRFVYMNGFDAILINASATVDDIRTIRKNALGLRGRRVKIIVEGCSDRGVIHECDGVVLTRDCGFDASFCGELLSRQKLLFTKDPNITDSCMVDILISSTAEGVTPATTVPSTPLVTSARVVPSVTRSFLFKEMMKFVTPSTRLIISLSDDGSAVAEISAVSRIQKTQLPPILGLSASESVTRYMTCLYGVIPLQTQSFISVGSVVKNAIEYAVERGYVSSNDQVVVVTQPPPVTASTNETCFEGVVFSQTV
jgi:hypothetical protein